MTRACASAMGHIRIRACGSRGIRYLTLPLFVPSGLRKSDTATTPLLRHGLCLRFLRDTHVSFAPTSNLVHPRNIHARRHHCTRNAHPAPAGVLQEKTGLGSAISRFAVVFRSPPISSYDTCTFLLGSHTTAFLTMPRSERGESGGRRCTPHE
jgi:hypothetical protein